MKHHTHASCFSVFALPHLLFIPRFEERRKVLQSCCLAWNISLFPDHQQRAQQIDMVWKLIETDNPDAPPPGLEEGFKGELHMLAEKKIDLFPWLIASIPRADLEQNGLHDRLHVETDNGVEDINLVIHPDPLGLPVIIDVLRGIQRDTTEQVQLLQRLNRIPNGIDDALVKQAIKSYSVQRADLIGYHRILTVWRQSQPAPSVQRVINHWLGVLDEIELNTKAILGIVEDYHNDAGSVIHHRGGLKDAIVERPGHYTVISGIDGHLCSDHPKAMTQRFNNVSNICRFSAKLTVNGQFMRDFMAEESPCFALGLVEERKQPCGFLALRPAKVIPPEISGLGFNFGHALLGTTEFEVIQFVFHFYGFETYNMLLNPNNHLVKKVLMRMVERGDYFFFAISPNQSVTAFRSEIGQENLAGLSTNLRQIQGSTTTDAQYQKALAQFRRRPDPPGQVLNWVCRDNLSYLDLTQDRLEMNPVP